MDALSLRSFLVFLIGMLLAAPGWAITLTGEVTFDGKARKDAAVHLEGVSGGHVTPPGKHAVVVQKRQLFIPSVLPVVQGTVVDFPNKDTVFHSAFSLSEGNQFDLGTYGPGKNPNVQFDVPGKVDIFCNQHDQMHAVVLVLDHPYFTLTSKKGTYAIRDVPKGTYRVKAWVRPGISKEKTVTIGEMDKVILDFKLTSHPDLK